MKTRILTHLKTLTILVGFNNSIVFDDTAYSFDLATAVHLSPLSSSYSVV
jgi:hypothetical protein